MRLLVPVIAASLVTSFSAHSECRDISGVYHILKKYDDSKYLIGEPFRDSNETSPSLRYKFIRQMILKTDRTKFSERGQIGDMIWVQISEKKVPGDDGFDVPLAEESIACAVDGTTKDYGKYAIALAAKAGDLKLVKALQAKGQDINIQDDQGVSVLDIALIEKKPEVIEYLRSQGAKVGNKGLAIQFGEALLKKKDSTIAMQILNQGIDPNSTYQDTPILYVAIRFGSYELIKRLVEKGADVNGMDGMNVTCLMIAAFNGKKDVVELLLSKGADPNRVGEEGRTARKLASEKGFKEIVAMLNKAGAKK